MAYFVKKPVLVEAREYDGTPESAAELVSWIVQLGCEASCLDGLLIETLEGTHRANPGDYIIKGVAGEFYPCKPDIFAATYEPANPISLVH